MTKIDIFSGFLGAGKTTLIKKLIKEAYSGEKVVLIENEFGEIGIDGGFLQDAGIEITEMNSGCICCSLVGDFTAALAKVLEEYSPDRIIIEPSGVGKLSDVIKAVGNVEREDYVLNCFTTVADATKVRMYMKNFGEFYNDQIANASAIVLSHTDVAKESRIEEAVALIREHNATAEIIVTPWDSLDGKDVLAAMEHKNTLEDAISKLEEEHREHHHHHHDHDEECCHGHHEHEHHHHDHGEECGCGHHEHEHHHHDHDEECCHGHHEHEHHHHDHDEECCHGHHDHEHHHHDHDEECGCGCHDHEHHHHDHDEECGCGCHGHEHGHHHADEVFSSFGAETTKKFTPEAIEAALGEFDESSDFGMVLRAKGIVAATDGRWIHFDYVPDGIDVRYGTAGTIGRLCVIGSGIDENKIKELFGI
ncbi:MAG: GTP-binding protein [Clostridia bacterium]|nr:GTP-binding protein [Clostridia bacterium]